MPMKIDAVPEKLKPLLDPATVAAQERTKGEAELKRLKKSLADRASTRSPSRLTRRWTRRPSTVGMTRRTCRRGSRS